MSKIKYTLGVLEVRLDAVEKKTKTNIKKKQ